MILSHRVDMRCDASGDVTDARWAYSVSLHGWLWPVPEQVARAPQSTGTIYEKLNGDTHSRRDYVFIYAGHTLGATVKGRYKRHWLGAGEAAASGMPEAYYDLYSDTREDNPMLVPLIHTQGQFHRMRARHELMKRKYPDKKKAYGIPYTGLSNARPETKAIADQMKRNIKELPFDVREYIEFEIPGSKADPDFGR